MARAEDQKRWREKSKTQRVEVYLPVEVVKELDATVEKQKLSGRAAVITSLLSGSSPGETGGLVLPADTLAKVDAYMVNRPDLEDPKPHRWWGDVPEDYLTSSEFRTRTQAVTHLVEFVFTAWADEEARLAQSREEYRRQEEEREERRKKKAAAAQAVEERQEARFQKKIAALKKEQPKLLKLHDEATETKGVVMFHDKIRTDGWGAKVHATMHRTLWGKVCRHTEKEDKNGDVVESYTIIVLASVVDWKNRLTGDALYTKIHATRRTDDAGFWEPWTYRPAGFQLLEERTERADKERKEQARRSRLWDELLNGGDRDPDPDLPDTLDALRKIARANHPDRNPDADVQLYQRAVEKMQRLRKKKKKG